ncbi:MAG: PAS domain-containing protein [Candidatus Helarchaeota archaeon]
MPLPKIIEDMEEILRIITDQSFLGIIIIQDNSIKFINKAISKLIGYSLQEIKEWTLNEVKNLFSPEERPLAFEQFLRQIGEKVIVTRKSYKVITKFGKIKWVDFISKSIIFQRRPANLIIVSDTTEREMKLQTLFEDALNPIFVMNEKGNYLDANKAALTFLECSRELLITKTFWDWVPPGQLEKQKKNIFHLLALELSKLIILSREK